MSMHHLRAARGLLAGAATVALLLGGALGASADPVDPWTGQPDLARPLDGVGTGSTQDLCNGLSAVVTNGGELLIASWDVTGPSIQTRPGGPRFPRPRTGDEGVAALRAAKTGGQWQGVTLSSADLTFARVVAPASFVSSGNLSYVPLAVDAVTYASGAGSTVPNGLASADLTAIYSASDGQNVTLSNGQTYTIGLESNVNADIVPLLSQAGTEIRAFFLGRLELTEAALGSAVSDTYSGGSVMEHDGSALAAVDGAIMPFSVAQHIGQGRAMTLANLYGVTVADRRHGAVLRAMSNAGGAVVQPVNANGTLNTAFPVARPVFTVIWHDEVALNPDLAHSFVGDDGVVYHATSDAGTFTIEDFGYGSLINRATGTNGATISGVLYRAGDAETFRAD